MEFTKLSAPSLKDLFINQIQSMILSGALPLGSKLPPERELAEKMQVSRAVVNGGIAELSKQGFLEVLPRSGTFVSDYRKKGNIDTLIAIMEFKGGVLGNDEIRSILEIDLALEHLAASRAIQYASDESLRQLGECLADFGNSKTPEEAGEKAFIFHHELALVGGNSILPLIYYSFKTPVTVLLTRFCQMHGIETMCEDTKILYNLICDRKSEEVAEWINTYLDKTINGSQQIYKYNQST